MRCSYPVAVQVCSRNFRDTRQRLGFDFAELAEIDNRCWNHGEAAASHTADIAFSARLGQFTLDEGLYVLLQNAIFGTATGNQRQELGRASCRESVCQYV